MDTRKYPRTMKEAFGPYTSDHIDEDRPTDWQDVVVVTGCIAAVAICLLLVLRGVIV